MVNFLELEYRDDGEKTWRLGCLERLEHTGRLECMERLAFVQTVILVFFNQFRKCLTKAHRCDIIIA